MIFDKPVTLTEALRYAAAKRVLALSPSIGTRDIEANIPAEIRERAFFSARTPYAGYLAETSRDIQRMVQPDVRITADGLVPTVSGESISPAQVRAKMKRTLASLGYQPDPDKRGGLQDLSSDMRVNLVIDTQLKMARGYGSWRQSQDATVLDLWPADELFRAISRDKERNWLLRWNEARASLGSATTATAARGYSGPFVALKNDPIWKAISRFGNPYPPFDYRSGMRVRDVSFKRARELGVLKESQTVPPARDRLNDPVEMDVSTMPAGILQALGKALAGVARITGDKLLIGGV